MLYLITNIYKNASQINIELRNKSLEKIYIKNMDHYFDKNVGDFVEVEKKNNKHQIIEKVLKPANFLDFYPKSKYSESELQVKIYNYYEQIKNNNYKKILDELIFKNSDFFKYPAAKSIHHAYIGGLSEHTINILELSNIFIDKYNLDKDLMFTSILLHDYSKLFELQYYGLNYTIEGNLIGHLVMTVEKIIEVSILNDIEIESLDMLVLRHSILSHHGKLEYGSAKEPMTKESYILSQLDETDAKMNLIESNIKDLGENEMSSSINMFDRRRIFNYKGESK